MYLKQLDISGIRNLASARLLLAPTINIFYGDNGSGKTSLLEAIYLLGLGRSFRAANQNQVINFTKNNYVVAATITNKFDDQHIDFKVGTKIHIYIYFFKHYYKKPFTVHFFRTHT